jgi:hypothetical protein
MIKFFTTSTLSDVQEINSRLIEKHFPNSEHIVIDGRGGWFDIWYEWLNLATGADHYIHLDEDCFITSPDEILSTIKFMDDYGYDIAGCPDGHHHYRSGNHVAFNSFFMILNQQCVDDWFNKGEIPQFKKEWIRPYNFEEFNSSHFEYNMEFGSSGKPVHEIWKPNTEPYYDFFWVLKEAGRRFLYLKPTFNPEFQTTDLLEGTVQHMWHMRERHFGTVVSSVHTMNNDDRFNGMINKLI